MNERICLIIFTRRKAGIPAEFDLTESVTQTEYLVDGQTAAVGRPDAGGAVAGVRGDGGRLRSGDHRAIPQADPKESLEALDAAVRAYDHGRGAWPTMSVQRRIEAPGRFRLPHGTEKGRNGQAVDVGDRQVLRGFREGVRPDH